jgi:AraC-like DNA-binding protein
MERDLHKRLDGIREMLFEIATGHLSYRVVLAGNGDEADQLAQSLNRFAGQLQLLSKKTGAYPYPICLTRLSFVLDGSFTVLQASTEAAELASGVPGCPFAALLHEHSLADWKGVCHAIAADPATTHAIRLSFKNKDGAATPAVCTLSRLLPRGNFLVSSVTMRPKRHPDETNPAQTLPEKVHAFILGRLDQPLPTIPQLSKLFRTNEFTLKRSFRLRYGTSIYQFYNDRRLAQAYDLIATSRHALKTIALMSGFNDYATFLKAFRKKYTCAPSGFKRIS